MTHDAPSLLHRLRFTPLRDLLRGRLTARFNWRGMIAHCDLPAPLRDITLHVVRRTRLWRGERCDVAGELIAHFQDGMAAGRSAEELLKSFGDPKAAAKLIRRAKIRNRPLLWHAVRWGRLSVYLMVAAYLVAIGVYATREPTIRIDYLQKVNEPVDRVPASDHAWPIYRQAMLDHDVWKHRWFEAIYVAVRIDEKRVAHAARPARPGDPSWPRVAALIEERASLVEALRRGSTKPIFGVKTVVGWSDEKWLVNQGPDKPKPVALRGPAYTRSMILALAPPTHAISNLSNLVAIDLQWAAERGDRQRMMDDYRVILDLARQMRDPLFTETLVSSCLTLTLGYATLADVLHRRPDAFRDEDLVELTHLTAESVRALPRPDFRTDEWAMLDMIQHVFTDDGWGNGTITPEAWILGNGGVPGDQSPWVWQFFGTIRSPVGRAAGLPMMAATGLSRKDAEQAVKAYFELTRTEAQRPLWKMDHHSFAGYAERRRLESTPRYALIGNWMGPSPLGSEYLSAKAEARGEAMMAAMAVEKFRRDHHRLPASLAELTPQYLPQVLVDHSTGKPLLMIEREGRPVLYGRGLDGVDDGGATPPAGAYKDVKSYLPTLGDWILFPPTFLPEATPIEPPATRPITNQS